MVALEQLIAGLLNVLRDCYFRLNPNNSKLWFSNNQRQFYNPFLPNTAENLQLEKQHQPCFCRLGLETSLFMSFMFLLLNKLCVDYNNMHKNSCTERLYAKRKEGGRGLINIKCTIEQLENSTWKNIMRRSEKEKLLALTITNKRPDNVTPCQSHMDKHVVKPLHGQYVKNTENMNNTFSWLKNPKISRQIESLVFAAQEQCIPTNYYVSNIIKKTN